MSIAARTHFELRQIRCFLAVAQEMNFTRAAQALHMAQPPLSRQIRDLETALGVALFDRTTRSVSLTAAGAAFLSEVQKVFPQLEFAVEVCRRAALGHQGSLKVGYTGRASQSLLPALMREFHALYPTVVLDIDGPHATGHLRQELVTGRLDAALCFLPVQGEGLQSRKLMSTPLAIALPSTHPLADKARLALRDLKDEAFVAYPSGKGYHLHAAMEAVCQDAGFSPRIVRESDASQTLLCMVAAGTGLAVIPAETQAFRTEGVVFRPLRRKAAALDHGIAWMSGNTNPALANLLRIAVPRRLGSR